MVSLCLLSRPSMIPSHVLHFSSLWLASAPNLVIAGHAHPSEATTHLSDWKNWVLLDRKTTDDGDGFRNCASEEMNLRPFVDQAKGAIIDNRKSIGNLDAQDVLSSTVNSNTDRTLHSGMND